ncbi:hypothetical protein DXG01_003326 [Tephrocybe rancida]|nr:hypothetical protein DXG01_003326 [Tephrocybe rancida]
MVKPCRSCSLDYNKKKYKVNFFTQKPRTDADPVLDAAEKQLTLEQQVNIKNRYHNLNTHREPSVESCAEGTSRNKGKNVDPRNWGASGVDHADMSVEAQQANLEYYKAQKKEQNLKNNKDNNVPKNKEHTKQNKCAKTKCSHVEKLVNCADGRKSQTPMSSLAEQRLADITRKQDSKRVVPTARRAELNPVDQVTSKSYLGQALKGSRKAGRHRCHRDPSPSSSSSSNDDSSSLESESEDPSSSSSDSSTSSSSGTRRHVHKHQSRKRLRGHKSPTVLKPIPPKDYNGTPDARSYHQFVTEGTAYLCDGKVKSNRHTFVLSYYLKDKAYDFYTQKVSVNSSQWTLEDFLRELFNYCFPINYRLKQREKLRRCFQNDKSVTEYVYELEELYTMIGMSDEQEQVIKLWHGLRTSIQKALWKERLNPEISTWEEVSEAAQIIEISEGVTDPRETRNNSQKKMPATHDLPKSS